MLRRLALTVLAIVAIAPVPAFASEAIRSMSSSIDVHPDASISVIEQIDYDFDAARKHGIFRDIPLSYTSADGRAGSINITDVSVKDEQGTPYLFVTSWSNGNLDIKIGDANTLLTGEHTYVISYTVTGALSPYDSFDELYWNATGDQWQVPIGTTSVIVRLPAIVPESDLRLACYVGTHGSKETCLETTVDENGHAVGFLSRPLNPSEGLTIAVGFPKGMVTYAPAWKTILQQHLFVLAGVMALIASLLFAIFVVRKDRAQGRGTIVAEYEPPQKDLRPAQVDVLVHGHISRRSWPATIVDLAVRGFVRIEETDNPGGRWTRYSIITATVIALIAIAYDALFQADFVSIFIVLIMALVLGQILTVRLGKAKLFTFSQKDYIISRAGDDEAALEPFEKKLLDTLLVGGRFSTKETRKDTARAIALHAQMTALEKGLYKETALETNAYALDPNTAKTRMMVLSAIIVTSVVGLFILQNILDPDGHFEMFWWLHVDIFIGVAFFSLAALVALYSLKLRPRLNKEGAVEREQWLGFKLYLQTAERYRLQNLTPETFEKFLPYAMVFGIEKKWARAFEGLTLLPPSWFVSSNAAGAVAFSPSAFAGSFGKSFSSSFASSGAGGASGGGGSVGGGAGGGGGGSW